MIRAVKDWFYRRKLRKAREVGSSIHDTNVQLERIAHTLELILLWQYGVSVRPPVVDESGPEPMTFMTDSEQMAIEESLAEMGFPPEAFVGGSDGEDEEAEDDPRGSGPSYHPV